MESEILIWTNSQSLSVFEQFLGLKEISVTHVEIDDRRIHIYCESKFAEVYCPFTMQKCSEVNQTYIREIRDLPISGQRVILHLTLRQFYSPQADCYFMERFQFVEAYQFQTVRYERHVYESCKNSSLQRVVVQEDLCWKTVNAIFNKWAEKALKQRSDDPSRALAIDEFAVKKGHKDYAGVLVDLEMGYVIDVLPYRDKDRLIAYFQEKGNAFCQAVEVFSCDMWDGYVAVAKKMFPNATIVIDRFHFFGHMNKALDHVRKQLRRQFPDDDNLKGVKWLLLKNTENLTDPEKHSLEQLLNLFPELKSAYNLKTELRDLFETDMERQEAESKLRQWVEKAKTLNNRFVNTFLNTYNNWKEYVLNYFIGRVSNGIVEGINNKIKMLKRMAFGFRNFAQFRLRIIVNFD